MAKTWTSLYSLGRTNICVCDQNSHRAAHSLTPQRLHSEAKPGPLYHPPLLLGPLFVLRP